MGAGIIGMKHHAHLPLLNKGLQLANGGGHPPTAPLILAFLPWVLSPFTFKETEGQASV
jgi:hypothetical protein